MKPFARFLALTVCVLAPVLSATAAKVRWNAALRQSDAWYASPEARALAASVLRYQTPDGGWPKNTDMTEPPSAEFLANHAMDHRDATIDNNATTPQLRFFARFVTVTGDPKFRAAFEHGFDYLLAAQYANGGWPQYFPLREGYYTHITYNDNAMVNVLEFLREAATGKAPFAFIDPDRRARAAAAVAKGIDCILKTQVKQNGTLTAWCAQHDEKTLAPAWARKFEPPSLSGGESVGIVRFLMSLEKPSPEIIAAVEGAVAWFDKVKVTGMRVEDIQDDEGKPDHRIIPDPRADPVWARFYELDTDRPLFVGRDSVFHYAYSEIERERRSGYGYYGTWAKSLLKSDYAHWRKRVGLPARALTPAPTAKP